MNKNNLPYFKSKLNNKILGFGHYYKICSYKKDFNKLDSFIRMRLKRYLYKNKDSKNKQGNLILTNNTLKSMGLKSLLEIKETYNQRKKGISIKKKEKLVNVIRTTIFY